MNTTYLTCSWKLVFLSFLVVCNGAYNLQKFDLGGGVDGPESIAFDCKGQGPYVGVSDGRILKWHSTQLGWLEFSIPSRSRDRKACDGSRDPKLEPKCGRPLGLKFSPSTCELYIADAYFGLMVVGPEGGVAQKLVTTSEEGLPFRFLNALDIHPATGVVYFTDSSICFQRRNWILSIISMDRTGRVMSYDPKTHKLTVLIKGLRFPNGVALSRDNSFLLVAESSTLRVLKLPLEGRNQIPEVFAQLERFPDNIKRNAKGDGFWVALNSGRGRIRRSTEGEGEYDDPVGVKLSEDGEVVKVLDGGGGYALDSVSEVMEDGNGDLWVGSVAQSYVGRITP
ncbi:Protein STRICTOSIDINE SYNTHASE-LIKE 10 [Linum perenne]